MAWRQSHDQPHHSYGADGPFSFCTYPFLLNPRAKSKLLHVEARIAMTKVTSLPSCTYSAMPPAAEEKSRIMAISQCPAKCHLECNGLWLCF